MTRLNQILAVEKGARTKAEREFTDAHRATQQADRLSGISRSYQPRDAEGEELPAEFTRVQVSVPEADRQVVKTLTRLWDVTATKDFANTEARADVVIDDEVLLEDAPATFLLFLEKQLIGLRTYVDKLPVLDPAFTWTQDPTSGVYRTEEVKTTRTKKVLKPVELSPATDKHPAQVATVNEDVIIGDWTTVRFSGAVTEERRRELLDRVDRLAAAVKYAREEANEQTVTDVHVGAPLLDYVFS